MKLNFDGDIPLYLQIAEQIQEGILSGAFPEESQVPSTTEISVSYQINPATVLKGVNLLADMGILYKKRGIGMFVGKGAREAIAVKRREAFYGTYIDKLLREAEALGITKEEIISMIERS